MEISTEVVDPNNNYNNNYGSSYNNQNYNNASSINNSGTNRNRTNNSYSSSNNYKNSNSSSNVVPQTIEKIIPDYPDLKVIFMSGYAEEAFVDNYGAERDFNFLAKPFTAQEFLDAVSKARGSVST